MSGWKGGGVSLSVNDVSAHVQTNIIVLNDVELMTVEQRCHRSQRQVQYTVVYYSDLDTKFLLLGWICNKITSVGSCIYVTASHPTRQKEYIRTCYAIVLV